MRDHEILRKAADLIEEEGHCKGGLKRDGRYCALGALAMAATGDVKNLVSPATRALSRYIDPEGGGLSSQITNWNDNKERTADEVINALRVVAALHDTESEVEAKPHVHAEVG